MDALVPVVMGSLTLFVLLQIVLFRPRSDRDRCIRNTDVQRPGA